MLRHGWNAAAYQLVNDSIEKWFLGDAVVGFVRAGRWRVVAGAPVCSPQVLVSVLDQWEAQCDGPVCYFGAGDRFTRILESRSSISKVAIGSQPSWNPQNWSARVRSEASIRMQFNRAKNKGVTVKEWSASRVSASVELAMILRTWLSNRGLPPLHFLVEPETLGFLDDRRVFVAEKSGTPVAFLVLCPISLRNGWLTEEFPRLPDAPNGTVELMMDTAAQTIASEGSTYLTMGLVPLAQTQTDRDNPAWLRLAATWARAHGRRFYNFRGLESFKRKFNPEQWETINAIVPREGFTPSTLYAIATAFGQQPAWRTLAAGMGKALRTEARTVLSSVSGKH